MLALYHFYDIHQNEIAISKQKMFHILPNYLIEDMEGEKLYQIKKKFSLFTTTYEITVFNPNILPVEQTLFLTVILNSIDESAEEEWKSSSFNYVDWGEKMGFNDGIKCLSRGLNFVRWY